MFGIGMPEMLLILAVALIIIGPKKLPDLAKTLGRALGDFKRATSDLKESIEAETGLDEVRDNFNSVKDDLKESVSLTDEAPASKPSTAQQKTGSKEPLAKVKEAFGELNAASYPETDMSEDDDAMGEDYPADDDGDDIETNGDTPHPEDKATP